MPKYLFHGSYTEEGLKGLLKDGGTKRQEAVKQAVESLGGTLEAYYFAFGDNDFYFIADSPSNVNAVAGSILGSASGTVKVNITVLLTPEEIDEAVKKTMDWHPPGQ
ncbi:MAG: GYD domain-containing protein [Desulfobacterales bacterium]|jgi:uncharacterized protein with GYD domain